VLRIASKIDCIVDSGLEKTAVEGVTPAVVEVTTKRGERLSKQVNDRRGSPKNPMDMDEIADKFRRCTNFARQPVPEQNIEKVIALVKKMEALDDVTQILKLL
jgi:2-methylcitrate dehydratase PrpD